VVKPRLLLVDLTNLAYRSYYQLKSVDRLRPDPPDVGDYIFRKILLAVGRYPNAGVICAVDGYRPYWRESLLPTGSYKFGRKVDVSDAERCIQSIVETKQILANINIPVIGQRGIEADDVVALLASVYGYKDCLVFTNDRDLWQLTAFGSVVFDDWEVVSRTVTLPMKGVLPDTWLMYRAMTGDSTDRVKGIDGVGPVTAKHILQFIHKTNGIKSPVVCPSIAENLIYDFSKNPRALDLKPRSGVGKLLSDVDSACRIMTHNMRVMRLPNVMCPFDAARAFVSSTDIMTSNIPKRSFDSLVHKANLTNSMSGTVRSLPRRQKAIAATIKEL